MWMQPKENYLKNCMRIAHGFKLPSTLFEAKKIWHVVLLVYVIVHGSGILLMCVTFCYATDSILLLYFMKGDKTCVQNDMSWRNSFLSIYST
jgi:hypothetical protein